MQDKKTLVEAHAFPRPPTFQEVEYQSKQGIAHLSIKKKDIAKAFLYQSEKKSPGPNMNNLQIICVL